MRASNHLERKVFPNKDRRNDLDALRAFAMLLGIFYHAALSLSLGFPWFVQDASATRAMYVFQSAVHGFRMPLFFIVSGFFTAMLWKTHGIRSLVGHRFRRVLLPCVVGLFTVVPLSNWMIGKAVQGAAAQRAVLIHEEKSQTSIWAAIRKCDHIEVKRFLDLGLDPNTLHPDYRITSLAWATLVGDAVSVQMILDAGCDPSIRSEDQNTALHAAAFLGRRDIASLLIERGADVNAVSRAGETPLATARGDLAFVPFIADILMLRVDLGDVQAGRKSVIAELERNGAIGLSPPAEALSSSHQRKESSWQTLFALAFFYPVFSFLWFLWFLWWYVVILALAAWLFRFVPWRPRSWSWVIAPWVIVAGILITTLPISRFDGSGWLFGPDTSVGLIPMGHVFFFYAVFFVFGIGYYLAGDPRERLGQSWRWQLPLTFFVIFPLALDLTGGIFGFRDAFLAKPWHRPAAILGQSLFAWNASLGFIGWFRAYMRRESPWVRYLSDASYWLYLTHLPLVIWLQMVVLPYPLPAWLKVLLISTATILPLLGIYHVAVRSTWIGWFLNGRRISGRDTIPYPKTLMQAPPSE